MFFLGGNFVSSLIWTLKSKKPKNFFLKNLGFFPAMVTALRPDPKSLRLRRFKLDWGESWQVCFSSKYASIHSINQSINQSMHLFHGVGFSIWRRTLKMAAMTSFHAEKCCHLVS